MNAFGFYAGLAAGISAASVGVWQWIRAHRTTPEQRERARRQRLAQIGRICDGTVVDVQEIVANGSGPMQLIMFTYDVGGVSYEASQDVTHLKRAIDIHSSKLGLPTSVKYDPQNPGNSIVVAEAWTGIRQ